MGQLTFGYVLIAFISHVKSQSACTTPSGGLGRCLPINQCDQLLGLLNKTNSTNQDEDVLRKFQCGSQENIPNVCCPNECFTPDGQLGSCVGVHSCPAIMKMLTQPISNDEKIYIQSSRCEGPDKYSVCCSPNASFGFVQPSRHCIPTAAPPDPRSKCCGDEGVDNIIVGDTSKIDQYPWTAIIEYNKDNRIRLLCGGALISGRYVLTAGHCVIGTVLRYGTPTSIRLGEYDIDNDGPDCVDADGGGLDCTEGAVVIPIERSIPHPDYNPHDNWRRNDIALLRLSQLAPYTDFIRPICLPIKDLARDPQPNLWLTAAGWGADGQTSGVKNIKLEARLPYKSLELCQSLYNLPKRNITLWDKQLCAGGVQGQDTCKGDSGGPLMHSGEHNSWEITGVISFGSYPCGVGDVPGVYTNVFQYLPWIRSLMRP